MKVYSIVYVILVCIYIYIYVYVCSPDSLLMATSVPNFDWLSSARRDAVYIPISGFIVIANITIIHTGVKQPNTYVFHEPLPCDPAAESTANMYTYTPII